MEKRPRTEFSERGLIVHGDGGDRHVDVFAGAMHYWRIAREDWRACLESVKDLGVTAVDTYVPWGVHDEGGEPVFTGDRDLGAFLGEVARAGLLAIIRPGPHINAELTCFGFPERVLEDPRVQAVTGRDTPAWLPAPPKMFPVPSYASSAFRREVAAWFRAVGEVVRPHLAPDGPVAAVQVDNEFQMFFRLGAFDLDYHPDALAWWREHAGDLEPPRAWDPDDVSRCARWVAFKEAYARRALAWLTEELEDAGLGDVARFHNAPPSDPSQVDVPGVAAAIGGVCGMDFYHRASDYRAVRVRARYLVGSGRPLPFAPEIGVGGPLWLPSMTAGDQKRVLLGLLAAGVRAFNLYMAVDRDRWYGAPITVRGEARDPAPWVRELLGVLGRVGWTSLRRRADVALVLSRAESRIAVASCALDPLSPVLGEFLALGPAGIAELATDDGARAHRQWLVHTLRALDLAEVAYDVVDEAVPEDDLRRYRALVMPTLDRVERRTWTRFQRAAKAGVRVVVGPRAPSRDEHGEPLGGDAALPAGAGLIRPASLEDLDGFAADLAALAADRGDDFTAPGFPDVHCAAFEDERGTPRLAFVGHGAGDSARAEILVPPGAVLSDPLTGEVPRVDRDGVAAIDLEPWDVRMFEVM